MRKSRIGPCRVAPLPLEMAVANRLQSFLSRLSESCALRVPPTMTCTVPDEARLFGKPFGMAGGGYAVVGVVEGSAPSQSVRNTLAQRLSFFPLGRLSGARLDLVLGSQKVPVGDAVL